MFTLDIDAQDIIGPNMVPCFATSFTVMLNVLPTGMSTKTFEVSFYLYKFLTVPGLYPR